MAEVRRLIGPTAWCALEVLVAGAEQTTVADRMEVATVRSVAADLGVSTNSAQHALTVLRRAGLISRRRQSRADGRFQPGRFVLHAVTPEPTDRPNEQGDRVFRRVDATDAGEQLTLLPSS